jgi:hypothetical protein
MAAARCSDTHDLAVPGTPSKQRAVSGTRGNSGLDQPGVADVLGFRCRPWSCRPSDRLRLPAARGASWPDARGRPRGREPPAQPRKGPQRPCAPADQRKSPQPLQHRVATQLLRYAEDVGTQHLEPVARPGVLASTRRVERVRMLCAARCAKPTRPRLSWSRTQRSSSSRPARTEVSGSSLRRRH